MEKFNKLIKGQSVFEEVRGGIEKHTIKQVGRKYFYIDDYQRRKFYISSLIEDRNYGTVVQLYLSKKEIEDKHEAIRLHIKFSNVFSYHDTSIPLKILRQIDKLIEDGSK